MEPYQENMHKALGLFIEAMRPYLVSVLQKEFGDKWEGWFYQEALSELQKNNWDQQQASGKNPAHLIDFQHLKQFALKFKHHLHPDFGKKVNNLPTWFDDIAEVRHKISHFQYRDLSRDEGERAMNTMSMIARQLRMDELDEQLRAIREGKEQEVREARHKEARRFEGLIPWFKNVRPHLDIQQGHLDESVFAANLAEVALGSGREIYRNPSLFFSKTYFTAGLRTVSRRVIHGLNGMSDAENRVMTLQTGFGGGKTHTLITLYHLGILGKGMSGISLLQDLSAYTGVPEFNRANIAVFTNTTNDPVQGRTVNGQRIRTLWGEIAWQLGGKDAYELIRANDEARTSPKGLFKKVLEMCSPALILLDEMADYCVAASGQAVGGSTLADQTISFMQELSEAVSGTDRCVLVATLPASDTEVASSPRAGEILNSLSNRIARVGADTKPVADAEIYEVIRRRLFEDIGDTGQIEKAVSTYINLYQGLSTEMPPEATRAAYREKMLSAYPFHPELIDVFRDRWASHHDFQRTRGVLRILASVVADLWKRQGSLAGSNALIHTSDVNFANLDALTGQLKKLWGNGYEAVINADVSGSSSNSFKIDEEKPEYGQHNLTQGIAATILLNSFGTTGANKGIGIDELKMSILRPESFNHNSVNGALDMMEGMAVHLYYSSTGYKTKRYWFDTQPNINILINQAKSEYDRNPQEVHTEIIDRLRRKTEGIQTFLYKLVAPSTDIPEQKHLTLVILGPEYQCGLSEVSGPVEALIRQTATKRGNSERIYRNTMVFLLCSELAYPKLAEWIRTALACRKIRDEYKSQLEADLLADVRQRLDEALRECERELATAYCIFARYSTKEGVQLLRLKQFSDQLEKQINTHGVQLLKDEEWLLESVGLNLLRSNNLLPEPGRPVKVKDLYEAFLRFDDKPMITGMEAISRSLLKYCYNGDFIIAPGDGRSFNRMFYKENVPGFDVQDDSYWLIDSSLYRHPEPVAQPEPENGNEYTPGKPDEGFKEPPPEIQPSESPRRFREVAISGKVDLANYNQIFTSFIMPLKSNRVQIEIRITGRDTDLQPLEENSQVIKVLRESARQLGLELNTD